MIENSTVKPTITALTPEQIEQVHSYSLKILADTGVRVDSPHARWLFSGKIGATALE